MMNLQFPRPSTSELLLDTALEQAQSAGCETQLIRLRELSFRHCEGYYSKSAQACTWPCSITQMDPADQLDRVYEAFVHWADAILIATSIRWGAPSSLYQKMVERMNCIQNQETIAGRHLLKNKAAAFIITGGQDNIQAVAGQMLGFFAEVGCQFPQFPFIAHSRGWSAEDMENNVRYVEAEQRPARRCARPGDSHGRHGPACSCKDRWAKSPSCPAAARETSSTSRRRSERLPTNLWNYPKSNVCTIQDVIFSSRFPASPFIEQQAEQSRPQKHESGGLGRHDVKPANKSAARIVSKGYAAITILVDAILEMKLLPY